MHAARPVGQPPDENVSYTQPSPVYGDSAWRKLDLSHDWSIEGPFDQAATGSVKTTGPAAELLATADRSAITADGRDRSFVTITVADTTDLTTFSSPVSKVCNGLAPAETIFQPAPLRRGPKITRPHSSGIIAAIGGKMPHPSPAP